MRSGNFGCFRPSAHFFLTWCLLVIFETISDEVSMFVSGFFGRFGFRGTCDFLGMM